jgi:hypothetical protein
MGFIRTIRPDSDHHALQFLPVAAAPVKPLPRRSHRSSGLISGHPPGFGFRIKRNEQVDAGGSGHGLLWPRRELTMSRMTVVSSHDITEHRRYACLGTIADYPDGIDKDVFVPE